MIATLHKTKSKRKGVVDFWRLHQVKKGLEESFGAHTKVNSKTELNYGKVLISTGDSTFRHASESSLAGE